MGCTWPGTSSQYRAWKAANHSSAALASCDGDGQPVGMWVVGGGGMQSMAPLQLLSITHRLAPARNDRDTHRQLVAVQLPRVVHAQVAQQQQHVRRRRLHQQRRRDRSSPVRKHRCCMVCVKCSLCCI